MEIPPLGAKLGGSRRQTTFYLGIVPLFSLGLLLPFSPGPIARGIVFFGVPPLWFESWAPAFPPPCYAFLPCPSAPWALVFEFRAYFSVVLYHLSSRFGTSVSTDHPPPPPLSLFQALRTCFLLVLVLNLFSPSVVFWQIWVNTLLVSCFPGFLRLPDEDYGPHVSF